MDQEKLEGIVEMSRRRQDLIMREKGRDYTRNDPDRLTNFKRLAGDVDIPIEKVWAIYAGKHWDAIMAFIKTGAAESEPMTGRLDDLHNYLYLLEAILEEHHNERNFDV